MREKQKVRVLSEKQEGRFNRISASIGKGASAMAIAMGWMVFFFLLGTESVFLVPVLAAGAAVLVISVLDSLVKGRSYGTFLCLMAAAAPFFFSAQGVARGIRMWGNGFLGLWNQVFGTFYEGFAVTGHVLADVQLFGIVVALLGSAVIWELVKRKRFASLTLAVFVPLCLGMAFSLGIPGWACALLVAGWVGAWCSMSGPAGFRWETLFLIAGVWALLNLLPVPVFGSLWQRMSGEFRVQAKQGMESLRFGEDTLPQGDLTKADRMLTGTQARLELEGGAAPLYLRGFVGSEYEGNRWGCLPAEDYKGEFTGMLSWLGSQQFHPGRQYGDYRAASGAEDENEVQLPVSVNNVGASRRYVYLPETVFACPEETGTWKQDWSMQALGWFGKKKYDFTYYNVQKNAETQMPDPWIYQGEAYGGAQGQFWQAERIYRSFVYTHYLELGKEQEELIHSLFFQGDSSEEAVGIYSVTSRIRIVLRILAAYQEVPARVPANKDFLTWFLTESKEGNAAYYASAATLAYRAAGIPARYVEGYLLTEEQAGQQDGRRAVLTGKNSHAWVEVYVDGMGWRAVEVTPGFYEEFYQADIVVAVPNESFEGAGGGLSGVSASEEYEIAEEADEERPAPWEEAKSGNLLVLAVLFLFLLAAVVHLARLLYSRFRYNRMKKEEKMVYLYGRIMGMMEKLYEGFNPEHPLEVAGMEEAPFDTALYGRTVKRMERIIYGQEEPAAREIPATEALAAEIRAALQERGAWRRMKK
ncbi:MAG: transglutaminase domain-containing protein [Lachnospiraceae bacterium]|nr:transglutaminase domain-containing protein [Lachnospiraceae bacterium]